MELGRGPSTSPYLYDVAHIFPTDRTIFELFGTFQTGTNVSAPVKHAITWRVHAHATFPVFLTT
jgi:hypothetical protein